MIIQDTVLGKGKELDINNGAHVLRDVRAELA